MDVLPIEVRQRPRPVVALVGSSDLHAVIISHLTKVNVDPMTPSIRVWFLRDCIHFFLTLHSFISSHFTLF
jgi:hypothetical protein